MCSDNLHQWLLSRTLLLFLPLPCVQTSLCVNRENHVVQVRVPAVNQDVCPWDLFFVAHVCEEGRREDWGRETARHLCVTSISMKS